MASKLYKEHLIVAFGELDNSHQYWRLIVENSTIRWRKPSDGGVLYTISNGGADGSRTHGL